MPKSDLPANEWYTVGQAAQYLGIAQSTFRRWVDAGVLDSFTTPGGHRRVTLEALERFASSSKPGGAELVERSTVLVIDDDPDVRAMLKISLTEGGFEVDEAGSAAEGVTRINERIPDLLMIDIAMPGTDGWQLLRALRERLDASELPVLVFSGSESLDASDARGAQAYARKPFDPTRLVAQARLLCDHRRDVAAV